MKKKKPIHAKLFVNAFLNDGFIEHFYKQNTFDNKGGRIILKEVVSYDFEMFYKKQYLYNKNTKELQILKNYIKTQKKVLQKHQKARNYDAYNIVKNSLELIFDFKKDFDTWFEKNK